MVAAVSVAVAGENELSYGPAGTLTLFYGRDMMLILDPYQVTRGL